MNKDVWTIRNTKDIRLYVDEIEQALMDLQCLVWDAAGDRPRRRVEAPEFYDCLVHMVWSLNMLLTFTESANHPLGASGYSIGHLMALAGAQKFHRLGHPLTMDDLHELERIGPRASPEEMRNMVANAQRILGLRGADESLE